MPSETALVQRESNEKQWCGKKNKKNKKQNKTKTKKKKLNKQNPHTQTKLPVSHYVQSLTIFKITKNTK